MLFMREGELLYHFIYALPIHALRVSSFSILVGFGAVMRDIYGWFLLSINFFTGRVCHLLYRHPFKLN